MTVQDNDQFLVCRSSTPYTLKSQNVMAELLDDDLMLVSRNGIPYKATGLEIKDSLDNAVPVTIETVALSEDEPGVNARYTNKAFTTAVNCNVKAAEPIVYGLKAKSEGSLVVQAQTSAITGVSDATVVSGFAPVTYTGLGDNEQVISGLPFSPSLVWIKNRTNVENHSIQDVIRGATYHLESNTADAQVNASNTVKSFTSDGFILAGGAGTTNAPSGSQFVAWCFDAGDTTVTNNEGNIETQVRSNGKFSVVSYVGEGTGESNTDSGDYFGHGLSSDAKFVIVKCLDSVHSWPVYHASTELGALVLNKSNVLDTDSFLFGKKPATSSVVYLGNNPEINKAGNNYIAYCWAESSTQSIGKYLGNGSASAGPVIECGFEPAFLLIKAANLGTDWIIIDSARSSSNPRNKILCPNADYLEEVSPTYDVDFTATGFQILASSAKLNGGGDTYIYMAIGGNQDVQALELIDPTGLNEFTAGDEVTQNGGGTPVSSAITNVAGNVLTLENDTGLENFRVGDVVQGSANQSEVWSSTPWSNTLTDPSLVWDGDINSGAFVNPPGPSTYTFATPITEITSLRFRVNANPGGGSKPEGFKVNGNNYGNLMSDSLSWVTVPESSLTSFSILGISGTYNCAIQAVEVNGQILIDAGLPDPNSVKVTVIDEATPSITTDGGTWAVGEVVTGPTFAAPIATVSAIDAASIPPTLTVSGTTTRWFPGKKAQSTNFVEVDDAELFAIFDAEGNISDMSGTDPGYRDMVSTGTTFESFNLQFPALFGNGKTPDATLPSGAQLCVDVKAANISGIDYKLDTCITPEDPDPEPQATMYGLRFDSARETYLNRNFSSTMSSYTVSFWTKVTDTVGGDFGLFTAGDSYSDAFLRLKTDQTSLTVADQGLLFQMPNAIDKNVWTHFVLSHANDGTIIVYKNGIQIGTGSRAIEPFSGIAVGATYNSVNNPKPLNGYLSEYFFVQNQTLPPTAFGYDYENQGKWAPLENTVIQQNIGDFGANGFYLPFDPAAVPTTNPNPTDATWDPALDDFLADTTAAIPRSTEYRNDNTSVKVFNFTNTPSGDWVVYGGNNVSSGNWDDVIKVNGIAIPKNPTSDYGANPIYVNKYSFSGNLNSIEMKPSYSGQYESKLYLIIYNGEVWAPNVQYNNIGVDDSGNGNDFTDQGFVVGNTSQIWSQYGDLANVDPRGSWVDAFRGYTGTVGGAGSNTFYVAPPNTATYTFPSAVSGTLAFMCSSGKADDGGTGTITLSDGSVLNVDNKAASPTIKSATGLSNITGFTVGGGTAGDGGVFISQVIVNGEILIDGNIADTVTDTPLKNYATLLTGENGNLVATGDSSTSYLGEVGTDYYYEEDGGGMVHTGGQTFSSTNGKTYNFGQQPFANTGEFDDSETWSSYLTTPSGFPATFYVNGKTIGLPEYAFDGSTSFICATQDTNGDKKITFAPPTDITASSSFRVYAGDNDGSADVLEFSHGSSLIKTITLGPPSLAQWIDLPEFVGLTINSSNPFVIENTTAGNATWIGVIEVDGRILVDTGSPIAAAYDNTLFQTWTQWNNVETLLATNPVQVARFEVIKEALEAYEGDKVEFRNDLMQKVSTALTAEEMAVVAVLMQ